MPDVANSQGVENASACRKCGSGLEPRQAYCLNCGSRAAGPRVPSGPVLEAIAVASLAAARDGGLPPEENLGGQNQSEVSGNPLTGEAAAGLAVSGGTLAATGGAVSAAATGGIATLFASKSAASTGLALMVVGMIAGAMFSPKAPLLAGGQRVVIVQGAGTQATGPAAEPAAEPTALAAAEPVTPMLEDPVVPTPPVPPTPPPAPTDPSLGHVAMVLLPGGAQGQTISGASVTARSQFGTARAAEAATWAAAFSDLKRKGFTLSGFKQRYSSGFANRVAMLSGAVPTAQMLATDDSKKPRGNENAGDWEQKTYPKGVMVTHEGKWFVAKLKAQADDEPGAAPVVWAESTSDAATEWSATATDSTNTPGAYAEEYVVTYTDAGIKKYWRANSATAASDVPGVSSKWDVIGTEPYTGPQPVRDVGCAGPIPAAAADSGCHVTSASDDLITLMTQSLSSQDQAIRVYVDTPEREDKDYTAFCAAPKTGAVVTSTSPLAPSALDNPVVWFQSLVGAPARPRLFKANAEAQASDTPGTSGKWTEVQPWQYTGPQPDDSAHAKGDWKAGTTYSVGDIVRHDHGKWWVAAKAATANDEPGKPVNTDAPVWTLRSTATSNPWGADSTISTSTPGSFKSGYVVTTTVEGEIVFWQAKEDTSATDEPGTSPKWLKIGIQNYAGPQPTDVAKDKGVWDKTASYREDDIVEYLDGNWYEAKADITASDAPEPGPGSTAWALRTSSTATEWDNEARDSDKESPGSYRKGWVISRPISESSLCSGPTQQGSIRPLEQMADDLRKADATDSENFDPSIPSAFPKLTIVIPSRCRVDSSLTCDDGTKGGPESLRTFLNETVQTGLAESAIFKKNGFVLTAWDRPAAGSTSPGGAVVSSAFVKAGRSTTKAYDTFSLTKTVQERFGIAGGAGMSPFIGVTDSATAFGREVFPRR